MKKIKICVIGLVLLFLTGCSDSQNLSAIPSDVQGVYSYVYSDSLTRRMYAIKIEANTAKLKIAYYNYGTGFRPNFNDNPTIYTIKDIGYKNGLLQFSLYLDSQKRYSCYHDDFDEVTCSNNSTSSTYERFTGTYIG